MVTTLCSALFNLSRLSEYSPGSSNGCELLGHELSHVAQQDGDRVRRKLTVDAVGEPHEREADSVARAVVQQEQQGVQRQIEPEEEEEKEEPVQAKLAEIRRQPEDKEEQLVQPKREAIQRQRVPFDEERPK